MSQAEMVHLINGANFEYEVSNQHTTGERTSGYVTYKGVTYLVEKHTEDEWWECVIDGGKHGSLQVTITPAFREEEGE